MIFNSFDLVKHFILIEIHKYNLKYLQCDKYDNEDGKYVIQKIKILSPCHTEEIGRYRSDFSTIFSLSV